MQLLTLTPTWADQKLTRTITLTLTLTPTLTPTPTLTLTLTLTWLGPEEVGRGRHVFRDGDAAGVVALRGEHLVRG